MDINLDVPAVFQPLWKRHARYKGAWGGRGSGKSHDRAAACVVELLRGERVVGIREVQRSIKDSVKQLVEDKIHAMGLDSDFEVTRDEIRSNSGGLMIFRGLMDYSAESIKSLEGFKYAWVEEAQTITQRSLRLLTPTIRAPGSELFFTWNPRYDHDPVDILLRGVNPPDNAIVVEANHADNPYFPADLRADMERDRLLDEDLYEHVWMGAYQRVGEGAYYAKELNRMRSQGRLCSLPIEREPPIYTGWDLGIDDVTAIWVAQPVGRELHVIDCYENRGVDAKHYADWVKDNEYDTGDALLPHDAGHREKGTARTYEEHLRAAGLRRTRVLPQTRDLLNDIQLVRSFMSRCWFDEKRCKDGLKALGAYRVEMDEKLLTPRPRPVHDWSSHFADGFRSLSKLTAEQLQPGETLYAESLRINLGTPRRDRGGDGATLGYDRGRAARSDFQRNRLGIRRS